MKKLALIFVGALALASCKTQTDGLASNTVDDVYYNPATDRKPNVAPQPEQYTNAKTVDPNVGKIGVTEADKNNPYYQDPSFNYDDYYDNAYAARIRRFNNPIYGTGYYDTYNTNSYFYNGNPTCYGSSIYSSYNMGYGNMGYGNNWCNSGWGYYSPSASFWNSYYNPYYNGYGSAYNMGFNNGFNMGMSYGMGGMYNPYGMGYGYNPYGFGGYNSWGSPYGYGGYYSPMAGNGYYNSYDYNSSSYSNYGPRGSHTGGNSTTTSPVTGPHHMAVSKPQITGPEGNSPYSMDRFNQVSLPKEHFTKVQEAKNPVSNSMMYQPKNTTEVGGGRPSYGNNAGNSGTYSSPNYGGGTINTPKGNTNYGGAQPSSGESKPRKWQVIGGSDNGGGNSNNNSSPSYNSTPTKSVEYNGGNKGGSNSGGGNNSGGSNSGGSIMRPRK